jgi:hypothetical protein
MKGERGIPHSRRRSCGFAPANTTKVMPQNQTSASPGRSLQLHATDLKRPGRSLPVDANVECRAFLARALGEAAPATSRPRRTRSPLMASMVPPPQQPSVNLYSVHSAQLHEVGACMIQSRSQTHQAYKNLVKKGCDGRCGGPHQKSRGIPLVLLRFLISTRSGVVRGPHRGIPRVLTAPL